MNALFARRLLFLVGLGLLISSAIACVPLRRHQDVLGELGRAVKINGDLATKLKDTEVDLARIGGGEGIVKANYEALQEKFNGLRKENETLQGQLARMQEHLQEVDDLSGFRPEDVAGLEGLSVSKRGELILDSGVLFPAGRSTLRDTAKAALDTVTGLLRDRPNRVIYIEGHTDNTPIRKSHNKDNWDLGFKRAHSVFEYLTQKGLKDKNFRLYSAGSAEPVDGVDPNSKEGQKDCRRVVIRMGRVGQG